MVGCTSFVLPSGIYDSSAMTTIVISVTNSQNIHILFEIEYGLLMTNIVDVQIQYTTGAVLNLAAIGFFADRLRRLHFFHKL